MRDYSEFRQTIIAAVLGIIITLGITATLRIVDNLRIEKQLEGILTTLMHEMDRGYLNYQLVARLYSEKALHFNNDSRKRELDIIHDYYPHFYQFLIVNQDGQVLTTFPESAHWKFEHLNFFELLGRDSDSFQNNTLYQLNRKHLPLRREDILFLTPQKYKGELFYYVAVFNSYRFIEETIRSYLPEGIHFQITAKEIGDIIFKTSEDYKYARRWHISKMLDGFDAPVKIEIWPLSTYQKQIRSPLALLFLIIGLLTTSLLTFVLYILAVSRIRSQELADTNIELFIEMDERLQVEQKMSYLATHDELTGLSNRFALIEHVSEQIKKLEAKPDTHLAVFIIDLDHFKDVNDALGHNYGDQLLMAVGKRLSSLRLPHSLVARLGGDEFALAFHAVKQVDDLPQYAQEILNTIKKKVIIDGYELFVNASIGIAYTKCSTETANHLVRNADAALYKAKELGRATYHIYTQTLYQELKDRIELVESLRAAIVAKEFQVYYQPKIDLISRRIVGLEALVRWVKADGTIIPPDHFIPIADDTGLIIPISEFVFDEACLQLSQWHKMGFKDLTMAINLSGRQFQHDDLLDTISDTVLKANIPYSSIELELTEQVFISNIKSHTNFMNAARKLGMTLAIDDFGVGYSSLSYLKHFPINVLKIDRSFIQDLPQDKDDATITQTIISLARSLDLNLVAEGVETEEQVEFLIDRGCYVGQGFLFSRPIPSHEMTTFLNQYQGIVPIQIE